MTGIKVVCVQPSATVAQGHYAWPRHQRIANRETPGAEVKLIRFVEESPAKCRQRVPANMETVEKVVACDHDHTNDQNNALRKMNESGQRHHADPKSP